MRSTMHPFSTNGLGTLFVLGALAAGPGSLGAQEAQLGLFAGRAVDEQGNAHGAVTLAPSLAWGDPEAALGVGGQVSVFQSDRVLGTARAWGRAATPRDGLLGFTLDGEGSVSGSTAGYRALEAAVHPRLRLGGAVLSVEVGPQLAAGRSDDGAPRSPTTGPLFGGEGLTDPRTETRTQMAWRVGVRADRATVGVATAWRSVETEGERWTEWTLEGAAVSGPLILAGSGGVRSGAVLEQWVTGRLLGRLAASAALVAEIGRSPSSPLTGRPGGRYAALGLVLTTGR
jgi:hypothetical protein